MALLLIIPSWILVLSIVLALCVAAGRGDQEEARRAEEAARPEPAPHRLPVARQGSIPVAGTTHAPVLRALRRTREPDFQR
jgi:hypothetical protein